MNGKTLTPFAVARAQKGLSLAQVSKLVDYDKGGLSRIERGLARPRVELASKLATLLELTRDQILFPEEYPAMQDVQSVPAEVV